VTGGSVGSAGSHRALVVDVDTAGAWALSQDGGQDGAHDRDHGDDGGEQGTDHGDELAHWNNLHFELGFTPDLVGIARQSVPAVLGIGGKAAHLRELLGESCPAVVRR
jgi:hypothetical protein